MQNGIYLTFNLTVLKVFTFSLWQSYINVKYMAGSTKK